MNKNNRICKIRGHDDYPLFHILQECNQPTRWCCSECIQKGVHNHNKQNISHVMKTKEILQQLQSESEKFKSNLDKDKLIKLNLLENIVKGCQVLENSLIDYRKYIQMQILNIEDDEHQANFKKYQSQLILDNFQQLDEKQINQILNTKLQQFYQSQKLMSLDLIEQQINKIDTIIKEYNSTTLNDLKYRKYEIYEIDQTSDSYWASSMSKNQQYLAYGAQYDMLLKIFDMKLRQVSKEIILDNYLYICQFTQDSSQLYVGLDRGFVYGYDVKNGFKEIFKKQIHQSDINNIITVQNEYLISCSDDKSIIKTEIRSKQQIFQLKGHTNPIQAIDYNEQDDIIVSGSYDKSIKFWNCKNQRIIINQEQSHNNYITQVQLINNNLNILSLDIDGNLYKWKIDIVNRGLIKLQQFSDKNEIFNFFQVNQDQNLILICKNYFKILNQKGETIDTIEHDGEDSSYRDCRQLDDPKYIQIRANKKIILAITKN